MISTNRLLMSTVRLLCVLAAEASTSLWAAESFLDEDPPPSSHQRFSDLPDLPEATLQAIRRVRFQTDRALQEQHLNSSHASEMVREDAGSAGQPRLGAHEKEQDDLTKEAPAALRQGPSPRHDHKCNLF